MKQIAKLTRPALAAFALTLLASAPAAAQDLADLALFDANGDGAVSRREAQDARAILFDRLDRNGDGVVSQSEGEAAAADRARRRLLAADSNRDGLLSSAEFMNQPYRAFEVFDANRDDVLGAAEIAALRARLPQR
jgi:Ca2+-binding EF-hand superfamily protein